MDDNIHITPAFCYHIQHSPVAKDHDCLRLLSMKIKKLQFGKQRYNKENLLCPREPLTLYFVSVASKSAIT